MPGVPRELIEHELHLDRQAKPVKHRLCHFTQDKKDVIKREIARLLDACFINEVYYPDWLTNPVLVPKRNKDQRMCVDYTDLNKACKKYWMMCCPSLHRLAHFVIQLCLSDSKVLVQLISGVYNDVYTHRLGTMQKRMLTTWLWSYPGSERSELKLPYVCPACSNHTSNQ
jgi:hypothetical protein